MEFYEINSGGIKTRFEVIKNTTESCPHCGVPACGREDILWYEDENRRIAIIFDGGYFDLALEEFWNLKPEYDELPQFMKEWNAQIGWVDCWDVHGYELKIDDFLKSMNLLLKCKMGKWITEEDIRDMMQLATEAKNKHAKLKILRG